MEQIIELQKQYIEKIKEQAKINENKHVQKTFDNDDSTESFVLKYAKYKMTLSLHIKSKKINCIIVKLTIESPKKEALDSELVRDLTSYIKVGFEYWNEYSQILGFKGAIFIEGSSYNEALNLKSTFNYDTSINEPEFFQEYLGAMGFNYIGSLVTSEKRELIKEFSEIRKVVSAYSSSPGSNLKLIQVANKVDDSSALMLYHAIPVSLNGVKLFLSVDINNKEVIFYKEIEQINVYAKTHYNSIDSLTLIEVKAV